MNNMIIFAVFSCFLVVACTKTSKQVDLKTAMDLKAGITTKKSLLAAIGEPVAKVPDEGGDGESWQYGDARLPRLSVFIPAGSEVIDSYAFFPEETDKESDLKTALNLFPKAKWKGEPPEWINPHTVPTECIFEDKQMGVSIAYNGSFQKVEAITYWNPARALTSKSAAPELPPQACIADQCVNYMSREEFKKVSTWELCKIPK